ncbi:MAG: outer membrane protein assembly factor BamA [Legionellales bacterium]|jgi:outer membrane protein insertion porin family|nr:outer membrane protein assembly factor BamA [Legionellales bacterium]
MIRKISKLIVLVCLISSIAAMPVKRIVVVGSDDLNKDIVLESLSFKEGQDVSEQQITANIKNIYKTGFYEDVSIDYKDGDLYIKVVAKQVLGSINLEGNDKILKSEQLQQIYTQTGLSIGKPLSQASVKNTKNMLTEYYKFQGYNNVVVKTSIKTESKDNATLDINITPGDQTVIDSIVISGNKNIATNLLLKQMQLTSTNLFSFFFSDNLYSRAKLDNDLATINNYYYDNGYMDFKILDDKVTFSKDKKSVDILFKVFEGPIYRFKSIGLNAGKKITETELKNIISLQKNDVFSRKKLRSTVETINKHLSASGHSNAIVTVEFGKIDHKLHLVDVTFVVKSGKAYTVRDINFSGNYVTDEKVLRHEFSQYEGSIYNQIYIDKSTRKLKNLGYLKNAICHPKAVLDTDLVDIDCKVEESLSSTMTGKIGYSDTEHFLYGLNFSQNNFLGTGNSMSLDFNRSEAEKSFNISHGWPNLTQDGISSHFNLFYKETTPNRVHGSQYHTDNYGFGFGFGIPVAENHRLSTSIGFEHSKIKTFDDTPTEITDYTTLYGDKFNQLKLSLSWGYNSLDKYIFPTSGQTHNLVADVALPYNDNNGTLAYYKIVYKGSVYQPLMRIASLGDLTFLSHTSLGYGDGLGNQDDDLPWFKNFFAGGLDTVRGYRANSLGPIGTLPSGSEGNALGGNILLSQSFNFIIPQNFSEDMRFTVFFDAGNVFNDKVELNQLRYSTGVSLQWRTSIAPLVFSLGFPVHMRADDKKDKFAFSISTGVN